MKSKKYSGITLFEVADGSNQHSHWICNLYNGTPDEWLNPVSRRFSLFHKKTGETKLKKGLQNNYHAIQVLKDEIAMNIEPLRLNGLTLSYPLDPLSPEIVNITNCVIKVVEQNKIPIRIITNKVNTLTNSLSSVYPFKKDGKRPKYVSWGFPLRVDPNTDNCTSDEILKVMLRLRETGIKYFGLILPLVDCMGTIKTIIGYSGYCDHFIIALGNNERLKKNDLRGMINMFARRFNYKRFLICDNVLRQAALDRQDLSENCVQTISELLK